tara:strand:+ start:1099 stop:1209 length:111 start_codon:yes stop_codon:yes gene_type:complete
MDITFSEIKSLLRVISKSKKNVKIKTPNFKIKVKFN